MEVRVERIAVREQTDVAEARRRTAALTADAGFGETEAGRAAIVATELATNIVRYGQGGEILLEANGALRILALDKGPGIGDVAAAMEDGFSIGGNRGEGLGAVRRQSDFMQVYSRPGRGTAVLSRIARNEGDALAQPRWSAVALPYPGEVVSGDSWSVREDGDKVSIMVADGLGHGLLAHEAARAALNTFNRYGDREPDAFLQFAHGALRPTRGAAVSMATVGGGHVKFAGVGNVAGVLLAGAQRKMISHNGTLGHTAKRFQSFDYRYDGAPLVVMHSDGLGSSFSLDDYPGLTACDTALIAGVLYRDFDRKRDDVTVVAVRP